MKENLSVIGTGLMGCSIAQGVKEMFRNISGYDSNPKNIEYALNSGIVNQLWSINRIAYGSDVIIVSVPVDAALTIVPSILNKIGDNTVVIDVGSTKTAICDAVRNHPRRGNFVASHPMAGSENSGSQYSDLHLLKGKKLIVCEPQYSSVLALNCATEMFESLGMAICYMGAETHDSMMALVSHLPQIVSYGIANTVASAVKDNKNWNSIASAGFDSTTRLAKGSADVWIPIMIQNKKQIINNLNLFLQQMERIKMMIEKEDVVAARNFIHQSQAVREEFENNKPIKKEQINGSKIVDRFSAAEAVATGIDQ